MSELSEAIQRLHDAAALLDPDAPDPAPGESSPTEKRDALALEAGRCIGRIHAAFPRGLAADLFARGFAQGCEHLEDPADEAVTWMEAGAEHGPGT